VVVETTRRCNLRCIHCAVSEENNLGNYDARDLSLEVFRKILPIFRRFKPLVQLSGHGETFLHPNFMDMLEEVSQAGCRVNFQTNGTILTPRNIERVVRAGVESIVISIDAANPELFQKIRRRARLDKIVENIRLLNETKKRLNRKEPTLGLEFVAMRQNIHELPDVVKMAADLGAANLQVAELKEYNLTVGQSLANDPLMADWASKAEREARRSGVNLILPPNIPGRQVAGPASGGRAINPTDPTTYKGLRKTCKEPWESMFVQFSGEVRPCCVITESYGDLSVQSFEEVWYGTKYQALRASLLTDEPFLLCARCPFYGWEPIEALQPAKLPADSASGLPVSKALIAGPREPTPEDATSSTQRAGPAPLVQGLWRRLVRKLAGAPALTVQLSDQQILGLLVRLRSPNPRWELNQIRQGIQSLPESCFVLIGDGELPSATAFVKSCYRKLLARDADAEGLRGYVEALKRGNLTRLEVVALLLSSAEFERLLLREADISSLGASNMNIVYSARDDGTQGPSAGAGLRG